MLVPPVLVQVVNSSKLLSTKLAGVNNGGVAAGCVPVDMVRSRETLAAYVAECRLTMTAVGGEMLLKMASPKICQLASPAGVRNAA